MSISSLLATAQSTLNGLQTELSNLVQQLPNFRLSSLSLSSAKQVADENPNLVTLAAIGLGTAFIVRYIRSPWRKLPPGPTGWPLIGSALELTSAKLWLKFTEWREVYGDLIYITAVGQRIIIINSQKVALELLERHAGKNSDRPRNIVAAEILTGGLLFVFTRYNEVWRRMRKAAHEGLHKGVAHNYHPTQTTEAIITASGILTSPNEWFKHIRRSAASSTMSVVYDTPPIASEQDPSVKNVNDFVARLARAGKPGAHLVELFPWMLYIPRRWAKWRTDAEEWHVKDSNMFISLFNEVRRRLAEGDERPSLTATLIEDAGRHGLSENENAWVAATMYAAGSETTAGVMMWWLLAMVLYPEVQKKAQEEIDAVVGRSRLPSFADMKHLPYTHAMVKESLRWRSVDPLGMPHYTIEDDWYEGMFIPKGTVLLANVWNLNRDPEIYGADAGQFNPARFLGAGPPEAKEEGQFSYGFGRRICVGRHVANNSLFIGIAMMLWAMKIEPGLDVNGKPKHIDAEACIEDGLVVRPDHFDIKVTPRGPEVLSVLEEEKEHLLRAAGHL